MQVEMEKVACFLSLMFIGCRSAGPNIILFITDDLGFNDLGFHGSSQVKTPNIDGLAYNGVIMDNFYTLPTCTPSRAALLTGMYPIRLGMQGTPIRTGEERHLPDNVATLAEKLKGLGYSTNLIGKWHLGYAHKDYTPVGRGFDQHFGYLNGFVGYFNYEIPSEYSNFPDNLMNQNYFDLYHQFEPQYGHQGEYSTYLFTNKSLEVIDNHDVEKPLFMVTSYLAGHTGYDGVELGVPNVTSTKEKYPYIKSERRQLLADVISIADWSIGQIISRLEERDMLKNSIIVYVNDNGAQTIGLYANEASNWPFRGLKFTMYEGGVRGSGIIYSPLFKKTGYVNKQLIHITDLMPTIYYAAGGNVDELGHIDGINQWHVLSENTTTNRTEILLNIDEKEKTSGILGYNGEYKLLKGSFKMGVYDQYYGEDGRGPEVPSYNYSDVQNSHVNKAIEKVTKSPLTVDSMRNTRSALDRSSICEKSSPLLLPQSYYLFNIFADPCETNNLIHDDSKNGIVQNLKAKLDEYAKVIVPQQNKEPDPKSDPKNCNNTWYFWEDQDGCYLDRLEIRKRKDVFHWIYDEMMNAVRSIFY